MYDSTGALLYSIHIQSFSQNLSLLPSNLKSNNYKKSNTRIRKRKIKTTTTTVDDDDDDDDDNDDTVTTTTTTIF